MSRPPLLRAASALAAVVLLSAGLATQAVAAPGSTVTVLAADLSADNVSAASTKWDSATGSPTAVLPTAGTRWALDIENKPLGASSITSDGLVLTVVTTPAPTKIRYQYYIGSGGYPTVDAHAHTLADMLASPISWETVLLSGNITYGPVFQVQLQRELDDGTYARVTVQTIWAPGTGTRDLASGLWFANTAIYSDGYPTGAADGYGVRPGETILNRAGSGPGVTAAVLATNFGDFDVVSFGPNLGRDYEYSYAFQNLQVFDHTFVFSEHAPSPSPSTSTTSSSGGGSSTPPRTTTFAATGSSPEPTPSATPADDELPTLAVPETTTSPAPPQDDNEDTPDTEAAETQDAGGFPLWIVLLGAGVLVFLAVLLWWLLRRRAA